LKYLPNFVENGPFEGEKTFKNGAEIVRRARYDQIDATFSPLLQSQDRIRGIEN
jgi:hypothetical protein